MGKKRIPADATHVPVPLLDEKIIATQAGTDKIIWFTAGEFIAALIKLKTINGEAIWGDGDIQITGDGQVITTEKILELLGIDSISGVNTGDQDLSNLVVKQQGYGLILDTERARLANVTNQDVSNFVVKIADWGLISNTERIRLAGVTNQDVSSFQTAGQVKQAIDTAIEDLMNGAPEALDTLKELSEALGNDPNFAATVAAQIGEKVDKTSITNNVTTGSETEGLVLDARQGAYLKYLIDVLTDSVANNVKLINGTIPISNIPVLTPDRLPENEGVLSKVEFAGSDPDGNGAIVINKQFLDAYIDNRIALAGGNAQRLFAPSLAAGDVTQTSIVVNWQAVSDAVSYLIEELVNGTWVQRYAGNALSVQVNGLTQNTEHTFRGISKAQNGSTTFIDSLPSSPSLVVTTLTQGTGPVGMLPGFTKMNGANGLYQYQKPTVENGGLDAAQPNETRITSTSGNLNLVPKYNIYPTGMFGFKIPDIPNSDFSLAFVDAYDNKDGAGFGVYQGGTVYDISNGGENDNFIENNVFEPGSYCLAGIFIVGGQYQVKAFKTVDGITITEIVLPEPIVFYNYAGITNPFPRISLFAGAVAQSAEYLQYKGGEPNTVVVTQP